MFLLTDDIFSVISGCQQNADQMKAAAAVLSLLLKRQAGRLCRCSEALPDPETLAMLHTGAMWILHITRSFSGPFNGKSEMCMWAMGCRTFGLWVFLFVFFLMWWKHSDYFNFFFFLPYSYLLATLVPLLTSTLDEALHHKSDSNILVTVHNICFSVYLLWFPRKLFH